MFLQHLTIILPIFLPFIMSQKALPAFSKPVTTVSRLVNFPSENQPIKSFKQLSYSPIHSNNKKRSRLMFFSFMCWNWYYKYFTIGSILTRKKFSKTKMFCIYGINFMPFCILPFLNAKRQCMYNYNRVSILYSLYNIYKIEIIF